MSDKYSVLFQPMKIGKLELKNRLCVPAMGNDFSAGDGVVSQRHLDYYGLRAKGGFGLIITEMMTIDRDTGLRAPKLLCIHDDSLIPGLRKLADKVHKYGAKLAVQIVHPGRCTIPEFIGGKTPLAPSAIPDPFERAMPRPMTIEEIKEQVENFAQAARRVKEAGCDAAEIHGAHAYLISQFMSAYANRRTDEYGGSFEGFLRFPLEIVKRTRQVVGPDFPLLFRIGSEEVVPMGRSDVAESVEMMKRLVEAGIDAADVSIGVPESMHYCIAPADMPPGFNASRSVQFKKALNVPVLVTGRIHEPSVAADILKTGKADLVLIGRQSLADPDWPTKVKEGRERDIVKCISCNEACIYALGLWPQPFVSCVQNLMVGREALYAQPKAAKPKKVLIAGGGPGGMEAARTAALRGHQVTLFEKEKELGGQQMKLAAMPPGKELYQEVASSRIKALKELKVDVRLGQRLTIDKIRETKPDVLIIATGSEPLIPNIPGVKGKNVLDARQALSTDKVGKNVLVIGGGLVGCETADDLSAKGKNVTIVEMIDHIAEGIGPAAMFFLMNRLNEKKVKIMTGATVKSIADDGVEIETASGKQKLGPFDTIVLAVGATAINDLGEQAKKLVAEVHVIGDAASPGKILAAVTQAAEIALGL